MDISSTYQEENISNSESEIEVNSEGFPNENTIDSTVTLLDKESQSTDSVTAIEKNKEEHNDDPLTEPNLLVTESNDNFITTQSEQESKDDEDEEDLEHIESLEHQDYDDQEILFVQEDNGDSDNMVSSIHTSDDTASENSLSMSSGMLVSPDVRTPSSPSQNSEDNNSIESMPTGDVIDSNSNSSNQNEYFDREIPVLPAPGETRSQILAPLDDNENEDYDYDRSRIQLTPILTKAIETDDDPPSPTLSEFSPPTNANNSNSYNYSNRNHLPRTHIPEILLRRQQLDFRHRQNSSFGEIALNIFHHQILLPFFQGFSWGIGIHLYRYMRNGFSIRRFWRSLSGGVRGPSSNTIESN